MSRQRCSSDIDVSRSGDAGGGTDVAGGAGGATRADGRLFTSTEPVTTSANPIPVHTVTGSFNTRTPATTATAG